MADHLRMELGRAAPGRFIVFEGLDGAGTSTQVSHARKWLTESGVAVEVTREPSSGPIGALIRTVIEGRTTLDARSLALAFAADRCDHTYNEHNGIRITLDSGRWVICDRYVLSSFAYQTNALVPIDWLRSINQYALQPDLTVFVDTEPEVCVQRIDRRSAHSELFHHAVELARVRRNYYEVLRDGPFTGKILVLDGNKSERVVSKELILGLERWLRDGTNSRASG